MTDQPQGPIYEYMMGTFDLHDATWLASMNDMLNNFGLAGWKRSVVTLLDARHLLVVMERRWPTAVEYAASQPVVATPGKAVAEPTADEERVLQHHLAITGGVSPRDGTPEMSRRADEAYMRKVMGPEATEASEYDDEAEAMMAAKVAEVIPWAARAKPPANGRRKRKVHKKVSAIAQRNKAVT